MMEKIIRKDENMAGQRSDTLYLCCDCGSQSGMFSPFFCRFECACMCWASKCLALLPKIAHHFFFLLENPDERRKGAFVHRICVGRTRLRRSPKDLWIITLRTLFQFFWGTQFAFFFNYVYQTSEIVRTILSGRHNELKKSSFTSLTTA